MDVLRALSSPNMDIRQKTLDIALDLITARNIDEVRRRRVLTCWTDARYVRVRVGACTM